MKTAHARIALQRVFGSAFVDLVRTDPHAAHLVVCDFQDAHIEEGISASEYLRRIGADNLRAYADVMLAQERNKQ
jgi:hypothetical protein